MTTQGPPARVPAYYWAAVPHFLAADPDAILGALTRADEFAVTDRQQIDAWQEEIRILRTSLAGLSGTIFLEFEVPRLGSRIDAVLVEGAAVFPIEFKCGEAKYLPGDCEQAWDYALDLKNFHRASQRRRLLRSSSRQRRPRVHRKRLADRCYRRESVEGASSAGDAKKSL